MDESWKDIPGTSGIYQASDRGRIRSVDRSIMKMMRWGVEVKLTLKQRVLKPWTDSSGYFVVYICGDGRREAINVHRLVALTFLTEREEGFEINHIDGQKQNNSPDNLEWCTHKQNMAHAIAMDLFKPSIVAAAAKGGHPIKAVVGVPIAGGAPVFFNSSKDAALAVAPSRKGRGNISSAATGKLRQAYGYFWKYADSSAT